MLPYDIAYNIRVYMIVIKNTNTNLRTPPPPPDRQFAGCWCRLCEHSNTTRNASFCESGKSLIPQIEQDDIDLTRKFQYANIITDLNIWACEHANTMLCHVGLGLLTTPISW